MILGQFLFVITLRDIIGLILLGVLTLWWLILYLDSRRKRK